MSERKYLFEVDIHYCSSNILKYINSVFLLMVEDKLTDLRLVYLILKNEIELNKNSL